MSFVDNGKFLKAYHTLRKEALKLYQDAKWADTSGFAKVSKIEDYDISQVGYMYWI